MKSRYFRHFVLAAALILAFQACGNDAQAESALETEEDKLLYAVGLAVGQNLAKFGLTEAEVAVVQQGFADALLQRETKVSLMEYGTKLQQFGQEKMAAAAKAEKAESTAFVDEKASEPGAVKTDSGMVIREITAGSGASPKATDKVSVHYHGTLRNGDVFDSSVERGTPATFGLNQVIKCWTEGVQMMKVGGKSELVCPSDIAYGDQGRPPKIPGGATLVFEVELLEIKGAASAPDS